MEVISLALPLLREELAVCFMVVNMLHFHLNFQDAKSLQTLWEQGECSKKLTSSLFPSFALLSNKVMFRIIFM